MPWTSTFDDALAAHGIGVTQSTFPAHLYVSLHTANPTTGYEVVDASGYARQEIVFEAAVAAHTWQQKFALTFGPAATDWGAISHYAVWDSSTGGNLLFWETLADDVGDPTTKNVEIHDTLTIPINKIKVTSGA